MKRLYSYSQNAACRKMLSTAAYAKTHPPKDIKIAPEIKRSETAVLEALSSTVNVDPTAPHYGFIDDPAMIPSNSSAKRTYYFAKEMGKRSARQLAEEWPTLFAFDRDQPVLPVFRPNKSLDPLQVDPTENNLLHMIREREVKDAAMLYERLRSENIDVTDATQIELLKLVVYYNGNNPPLSELEDWHGLRNFGKNEDEKWNEGGIADLLFETLPKTPETVSIMISGLCKYPSSESIQRAQSLYKEYLPKEFILQPAFDFMILISKWEDAQKILHQMEKLKYRPSSNTWNACIRSISNIVSNDTRHQTFMDVIGHMKHLNELPSLSTYGYLIKNIVQKWPKDEEIVLGEKGKNFNDIKKTVSWLVEILDDVEKRSMLTVQMVDDYKFYYNAMQIAYRCKNQEIAEKILKLYESKKNSVKLPFSYEGDFYNHYLALYIEFSPSIDDIAEKYLSFVPRLVGVSSRLSHLILERVQKSPNWPLLLRVIEDGISSRLFTDVKLEQNYRKRLLDVSFETLDKAALEQYINLIKKMVNIMLEFSNFNDVVGKRLQKKMYPGQITEYAQLLNRIGESEKAFELLEMLLNHEHTHGEHATIEPHGRPAYSAMHELFDTAVKYQDVYRAAICLEIMSQIMSKKQLEAFIMKIHTSCKVTEQQSRLIDGFVRLLPQ